ncbi:MAG TPA: S53 family peptidase [Rhizomicrobium sp.]|jgi:subtilase family serine protease
MAKKSSLLPAVAIASAAVLAAAGSASAARLARSLVPDVVVRHDTALVGAVNPATPMKLQVVLPMRNLSQLHQLLDQQIYNPDSPQFHHYLSVAEFTARFGPSQSDYQTAMNFFNANGLRVTGTSANRYLFQVEGSASVVQRVLGVKLNLYRHPSENRTFMAPDREPVLALGVPLQDITSLDTYVLPHPKIAKPGRYPDDNARPRNGSGPGGNYIGSDFRAAYYGTGAAAPLTGKGQSVGLMELQGYIPSDVQLYFKTFGPALATAVKGISVDGATVKCNGCDDSEQTLDIDYAISMAPGLDQVQVYVGKDAVAVENRMASDNVSKQLSTSWGYGERFSTEDPIYLEMAAQGQSWFTASGDDKTLSKSGPWPEEDAHIIAVGGTDLVTNGAGGAWKSESGWVDSAAGPALDKTILIRNYQLPYITAANGGSKTLRNVSDVSANANFNMMFCADGKCSGGLGGTSFSSPIWAGFAALANEKAAKEGKQPIGFFSPLLYKAMLKNKALLHDVVGNQSGLFPAVTGYDLVGGLGSPAGLTTIKALIGDK